MRFRINHTAIAFAANNGIDLLHLHNDVDFAHGSGAVCATILARNVTQGARR